MKSFIFRVDVITNHHSGYQTKLVTVFQIKRGRVTELCRTRYQFANDFQAFYEAVELHENNRAKGQRRLLPPWVWKKSPTNNSAVYGSAWVWEKEKIAYVRQI